MGRGGRLEKAISEGEGDMKKQRKKFYPIYHCKECDYFYKDAAGTKREGLSGQQTTVTMITCAACKEKPK